MGFDKPVQQDGDASFTYKPDWSLNGHKPVWPDLVPSKDCSPSGFCPAPKPDQQNVKKLEDNGWLQRLTLFGNDKSEDLYRFGGLERGTKKVDHVMTMEDYEVRIKDLEARLAAQTEKLARLIASEELHKSADNGDYSNRPTNLSRPGDGSHYVFDRNGNGQLIGPHGESQYNLINGERVWISDANRANNNTHSTNGDASHTSCSDGSCSTSNVKPVIAIDSNNPSSTSDYPAPIGSRSGCAYGSCGSCSSCRPRPRLFR
jgi:hypothetical protein